METTQEKAWIAKIVGACYFILLGFVYTIMQIVWNQFSFSDLGVLLWVSLPLMINKRWLYLTFGALNLVIWFYVALSLFAKSPGEPMILLASGITMGSVVAAFLMIYSALNISAKKFNLI